MKYVLEMNEQQAKILQVALEFYARVRNGQWSEIPRICLDIKDKNWHEKMEDSTLFLEGARKTVYPDLMKSMAHSYGVGKFPDADMAWELYTTVRHCMAWAKNPDGGCTVDYDPPISMRGNEIAKCTIADEEEE